MKPAQPFQHHSSIATAFLVALFTHFAAPSAFAVNSTWVGGYAATGIWNQAAQWSEGSFTTNSDVIFNDVVGVSTTATLLGTARTVNSITFNGGPTTDPAFNIRLATSGGGGTAANLTFKSGNSGITIASTDSAAHSIGVSDGSVVLAGNLPVTHNGSGTLTINRPISDSTSSFGVTKSGAGTLTLSAANTYDGQTTINDGILRCGVGGGCATSKVVVGAVSATHSISITDSTKTWTCAELAPTAAGKLEFNFAAILPSNSVSPLTVTGLADFTTAAPPVHIAVSAGLVPGTYPLMTWGSTSGTSPATFGLTVSTVAAGTAASLQVSGNTLNLVISSTAVSVVKADNALNLNDGNSWVGAVAPDATKVAKWNNTVTSANTTSLGADVTWAGIAIENPTGLVTINGTSTLTLGAAAMDIDMSSATADLILNCPLALSDAHSWSVAASRMVTLDGQISGAFGITKLGAGKAILSSTANSYTGTTTVSDGTLQLGASNVIPHGASTGNVAVNGTLDLNGQSETLNGLSGVGIIDNPAASTISTLTVGSNDPTGTFSGILKNTGASATLNLIKTGTGTQILGGANTLSGAVTISGGTLAVSNITPLANVSGITIGGGAALRPDVTNAVINAPITLGAVGTTSTITAPNVAGSGTTSFPFNLGGAVSGAGNLTLVGVSASNAYGAINLNAASNYTGTTLITCSDELAAPTTLGNHNIFVRLFVTNALPVTTVLTLDGGDGAPLASAPGRFCELNLNGNNQTLAGLTNVTGRTLRVQRLVNNSATAATLTVNNSVDYTYSGQLGWVSGFGSTAYNNFNLTKSGGGVQTLSGTLKYAGNTTVNSGTLSLGNTNPNNDLSTVTIANAGAFLNLNFVGSDTVEKLFIGSTQLAAGVYGPSATNISQITGTGTLTVTSGPGYASWKTANSTVQTIDLDHDNDGVSNGVEYFIGGNTNTTGFTPLPAVTNTGGILSITWTKAASYTGTYGTDFWVETSSTLSGAWTTETSGVSVTFPSATEVKYTFPAGTRNFARLKVTGP